MKTLEVDDGEKIGLKAAPIRRILLAVGLRDESEATVRYAANVARAFNASLYVTYVRSPYRRDGCDYNLIDPKQMRYRDRLGKLTERSRDIIRNCRPVFLVGDPVLRTCELARDLHADLIVTGSHHRNFGAGLFKPDKAMKIMRHAFCPVVVYHRKHG
jgi:nucleotide-binding universal stress UspA family protein